MTNIVEKRIKKCLAVTFLMTISLLFFVFTSILALDEKEPLLVKDAIIVKFKSNFELISIIKMTKGESSGIPSIDKLIQEYQVQEIRKQFRGSTPPQDPDQIDLSRTVKVKFASTFDPKEVALSFSENPYVEYAQTIGIHQVTFQKDSDKNKK